jgi:UDP-N-acetylmuramate--alanine ligase
MVMKKTIKDYKKLYFIGIGGISMSGIAQILHSEGYIVSGSDGKESILTKNLKEAGVDVFIGHSYNNVPQNTDLVVHTSAINMDNEEIVSAKDKNIEIVDRAYLLGLIMKEYKRAICITGTHGKTTATSMMSEVLLAAKKNPTIMLGGVLNSIGSNYRIGGSEYFLAESCEYFDSFLSFFPNTALILNVELDHVDYFKNINHVQESFNKFCKNVQEDGVIILNNNIENIKNVTKDVKCKILTYGNKEADYYADNITFDANGLAIYDVMNKGKKICQVKLGVRGHHNIENSLGVFVTAINYNITVEDIVRGLYNFKGVNRRYEVKGEYKGVTIVDDYAHHPTEIKVTLKTAKNTKGVNKVIVVFQPHTYTRTEKMLDDFASSFKEADEILLVDIYASREIDTKKVHSKDLLKKINETLKSDKKAIYFDNFKDCEDYIINNCKKNDLLITMGAGDVNLIGESLLNKK